MTLSNKPIGQSVINAEKLGVGHIYVTIGEHFFYQTTKLGMGLVEDMGMGLLESVNISVMTTTSMLTKIMCFANLHNIFIF